MRRAQRCILGHSTTIPGARGAWMRSEAMWFGPVMDRRPTSLLDWSPTDTSGIDRLLAEGSPTTAEEVRNVLGSNRRGFGAIEYLLFRNDDLADTSRAVSVCPYLVALSTVAHEETGAISNEWAEVSEGRPAYRDYFSDRASSSMLPSAAVADIVDVRLATAMGLRQDPADPSAIPGTSADNGLNDIRYELMGMRGVYEGPGDEGLGIDDLVSQLSEDTDARLRNEFDAATAAMESVSGPFRPAAVQRTPKCKPSTSACWTFSAPLQRRSSACWGCPSVSQIRTGTVCARVGQRL